MVAPVLPRRSRHFYGGSGADFLVDRNRELEPPLYGTSSCGEHPDLVWLFHIKIISSTDNNFYCHATVCPLPSRVAKRGNFEAAPALNLTVLEQTVTPSVAEPKLII